MSESLKEKFTNILRDLRSCANNFNMNDANNVLELAEVFLKYERHITQDMKLRITKAKVEVEKLVLPRIDDLFRVHTARIRGAIQTLTIDVHAHCLLHNTQLSSSWLQDAMDFCNNNTKLHYMADLKQRFNILSELCSKLAKMKEKYVDFASLIGDIERFETDSTSQTSEHMQDILSRIEIVEKWPDMCSDYKTTMKELLFGVPQQILIKEMQCRKIANDLMLHDNFIHSHTPKIQSSIRSNEFSFYSSQINHSLGVYAPNDV